ncbi:hypothetical protein [Streptosporangium sp. LJ11]|uniref:hypothetical protein n=1 Tax=Streptosporangium sp. LJ11 TaxID=3436927 RepID=UPI003F7A5236
MSIDNHDLVRAWKDPEFRGDGMSHPSGDMNLDLTTVSGGNDVTSLPCGIVLTDAVSCWPSCGSSAWVGTCAAVTVGCCKPHFNP